MKDLNKELEKKYERMGKLRADISVMPRPFTITIYTLIIISVVGLLLSFLLGITIAMWVAAGSLLVVILMYFIASRICPVRYTEVMVKSEGKRLVFQVLSEKNVIFSDGEYTLEYKNKEVKERPSGIMYPELSYAAPLKAHYTRTESKSNKMFYVGDYTTADGKKNSVQSTSQRKIRRRFQRQRQKSGVRLHKRQIDGAGHSRGAGGRNNKTRHGFAEKRYIFK